jgi:CheY-like chemotaxis protein
MHALIIEDEPMIALLIEDQLRDLGFSSIDFAVTETEAVASADKRCPDLITSDVRLLQGCGIAAVQAICARKCIPVIFITATARDVRERVSDALVVAKPFGRADLTRALVAIGVST